MSEEKKYGAMRQISMHEMQARSRAADWYPSDVYHEHEVGLITELARLVARDRRQFVGWPTIELFSESGPYATVALRAEVRTKAL